MDFAGVRILLRGGVYELAETVTLTAQDSGPLTIRSYPNEQARLMGGKEISGWKPVTDAETLNRMGANCKDHVFSGGFESERNCGNRRDYRERLG